MPRGNASGEKGLRPFPPEGTCGTPGVNSAEFTPGVPAVLLRARPRWGRTLKTGIGGQRKWAAVGGGPYSVYRNRSVIPRSLPPCPPPTRRGLKKDAPLCGAIFYKGGAKRRNLIPLDPFFGKRGAAAAAGYSSPLGVADASDNRIAAPPRRFAPPLRRRGKRGCDTGTVPPNRIRLQLRCPSKVGDSRASGGGGLSGPVNHLLGFTSPVPGSAGRWRGGCGSGGGGRRGQPPGRRRRRL